MYNTEKIIEKFRMVHGDKYDYSKVIYSTIRNKVCITCKEHGEFLQEPRSHISGQGCPICGNKKRALSKKNTQEEFINKCIKKGYDNFIFEKVEYIDNKTKIIVTCKKHGDFNIRPDMLLQGHGCPKCKKEKLSLSHKKSPIAIDEIVSFIKSICNDIQYYFIDKNEVEFINHNLIIKVLCVEKDNEIKFTNKKHHLLNCNKYENENKQIIQIYDSEWFEKNEICKSRLSNFFKKTKNKIFARKCIIREIDNKTAKEFCNINHIQGGINSKFNIGLFYDNKIVSVMTFGSLRKNLGSKNNDGSYELIRFCNKLNTSVIGGATKMFKYFIEKYTPDSIISYADRRWSIGKLYINLGFVLTHLSEPNYFYIKDKKRVNRFSLRKDVLISKYGCPIDMTEKEFCYNKGWYRMYDCGCRVYKWKK